MLVWVTREGAAGIGARVSDAGWFRWTGACGLGVLTAADCDASFLAFAGG
jgi:hypothetical protein